MLRTNALAIHLTLPSAPVALPAKSTAPTTTTRLAARGLHRASSGLPQHATRHALSPPRRSNEMRVGTGNAYTPPALLGTATASSGWNRQPSETWSSSLLNLETLTIGGTAYMWRALASVSPTGRPLRRCTIEHASAKRI
ncbi:hypothetical protein BST61_g10423 [Cercospora zeina]